MKKVFKLEELDCAHCAQKMENEIKKLDGVINVQINFLSQKFTLETHDECFDEILEKAKGIIKKIEPDCCVIAK